MNLMRKSDMPRTQSTVSYRQTHKPSRPNPLPSTVRFDRIDAAIIKITDSILKENGSTHI